jgi:hypothetical protein
MRNRGSFRSGTLRKVTKKGKGTTPVGWVVRDSETGTIKGAVRNARRSVGPSVIQSPCVVRAVASKKYELGKTLVK